MNATLGGWAISGIWAYSSGAPYSILSGYGTLNRTGNTTEHISDANNTASVNGPVAGLSSNTSGVWKTGDTVYFINPSLINPADGRGASSAGSAPFPGQVFFNPGPGTVGNLQRRMFSGPWQWSFDTSVKKSHQYQRTAPRGSPLRPVQLHEPPDVLRVPVDGRRLRITHAVHDQQHLLRAGLGDELQSAGDPDRRVLPLLRRPAIARRKRPLAAGPQGGICLFTVRIDPPEHKNYILLSKRPPVERR